jgi:hypothetical protein
METTCPTAHLREQPVFETGEHVELFFHTLSHLILHDCIENLFSFDYFSLITALKRKQDINSMDLIESFSRLYKCYQREKSLINIQFLPFCTDSTEGLFQIMDSSNSAAVLSLRELKIDISDGVRRFLDELKRIMLDEYSSFFKENRKVIRDLFVKDAQHRLSSFFAGRGCQIYGAVHRLLKKPIHVHMCPALTEHGRMMTRKGRIAIAVGDLKTPETVMSRFFKIVHEASHGILDRLVTNACSRTSAGVISQVSKIQFRNYDCRGNSTTQGYDVLYRGQGFPPGPGRARHAIMYAWIDGMQRQHEVLHPDFQEILVQSGILICSVADDGNSFSPHPDKQAKIKQMIQREGFSPGKHYMSRTQFSYKPPHQLLVLPEGRGFLRRAAVFAFPVIVTIQAVEIALLCKLYSHALKFNRQLAFPLSGR